MKTSGQRPDPSHNSNDREWKNQTGCDAIYSGLLTALVAMDQGELSVIILDATTCI